MFDLNIKGTAADLCTADDTGGTDHADAEVVQEPEDMQQKTEQQELTLDLGLRADNVSPDEARLPDDMGATQPEEVVSSRGHQILTLHDINNDQILEQIEQPVLESHFVEDLTVDLPDVPPIWEEDVDDWSDTYSGDLIPAWDDEAFNETAWVVDQARHPVGPTAFDDMYMEYMVNNSMQLAAMRDTTYWQFEPDVFKSYDMRYGPFQVDACADDLGRNAQCEKFWCPNDSYTQHSWAGLKVWCNPPFEEIAEVSDHATASYYDFPENTRALFVLPDWPDAKWWPTMTSSNICHCVG